MKRAGIYFIPTFNLYLFLVLRKLMSLNESMGVELKKTNNNKNRNKNQWQQIYSRLSAKCSFCYTIKTNSNHLPVCNVIESSNWKQRNQKLRNLQRSCLVVVRALFFQPEDQHFKFPFVQKPRRFPTLHKGMHFSRKGDGWEACLLYKWRKVT